MYIYYKPRKESLNLDGQQFYQNQQNEQSLLTSNHWTQKRPEHTALVYIGKKGRQYQDVINKNC